MSSSSETPAVEIRINGEPHFVNAGLPLPELIAALGLPPKGVLVEHNGRALLRDEWENTRLAGGDRLEILRVVAGG